MFNNFKLKKKHARFELFLNLILFQNLSLPSMFENVHSNEAFHKRLCQELFQPELKPPTNETFQLTCISDLSRYGDH